LFLETADVAHRRRLPVFALPPAKPLRILIGPEASKAQNNIAALSAEAAR
jgi:hypothetical protein